LIKEIKKYNMKIEIEIDEQLIGLPTSDYDKINFMMEELKTTFPMILENMDKISFLTKNITNGE
jgi:hypothetical protein